MATHVFIDENTTQDVIVKPNTIAYGINMDITQDAGVIINKNNEIPTTNNENNNTLLFSIFIIFIIFIGVIFIIIIKKSSKSKQKSFQQIRT
jgi:hypothetical protein